MIKSLKNKDENGQPVIRMFLVLLVVLGIAVTGFSHSGRTNSEGCHNNRKTGGYHCHNAPKVTSKSYEKVVPKASVVQVDSLSESETEGKSAVCCKSYGANSGVQPGKLFIKHMVFLDD